MTEFARMHRSDHSMLPPTPAATMAYQSPNACNLCHTDKDAAWADKYVRQWRHPGLPGAAAQPRIADRRRAQAGLEQAAGDARTSDEQRS